MKNVNNFTQWKNGSVDVTWRSTQSAVDIFNTLRIFTKEPIREQEIKLECMNAIYCN